MRLNVITSAIVALTVGLAPATATAQTKLLRFPDIGGDRIAFC